MKSHVRELLTDLKAAATIGHLESVQNALDGIRAQPDAAIPPSSLFPLGTVLARLSPENLKSLAQDEDPAIRLIAAIALGKRYMLREDVKPEDLLTSADDPNAEVRNALSRSLTNLESGVSAAQKLLPLTEVWLRKGSPNLIQTSLQILPACLPAEDSRTEALSLDRLYALLQPLHTAPDHDLRAALVENLNKLAEGGMAETILRLLSEWAEDLNPNMWVITRTLSASWAQKHSPTAVDIFHKLARQKGLIRPIARALARHEPIM